MKSAAICVAAMTLSGVFPARADEVRFELAGGVAHSHINHCGLWIDCHDDYSARLNNWSWQAGARWNYAAAGAWAFGLRGGWADLGLVRARAMAHGGCWTPASTTTRACEDSYQGRGKLQGVTLGPTIERSFGPLTVGLEGGAAYLYGWWKEDIRFNIYKPANANAPFEHSQASGWNLTGYYGVNLRWGPAVLSFRGYPAATAHGHCGAMCDYGLTKGATQLLLGVSL